jgi:virginiamycin A acetyltransferase
MPIVSKGHHSYGSIRITYDCPEARVLIGNYCSLAEDILFFGKAHHHTTGVSSFPFHELFHWDGPTNAHMFGTELCIEHDVWIGQNVSIMKGVRIGTGAVIGAYSVITKDVPPYAIVCGNPGVIKRYRFAPDVVERLLASQWWLMTKEDLAPFRAHLTGITEDSVHAFLEALDQSRSKDEASKPPEPTPV